MANSWPKFLKIFEMKQKFVFKRKINDDVFCKS